MNASPTVKRPAHVPVDRVVNFDLYQPMRPGLDLHDSWKAFQREQTRSVVWTPYNGGHWIVLNGPLVERVLEDQDIFTSHTVLVPKDTAGEAYRLIPLSLDPPKHGPFRKLLDDNLNPNAVRAIEDGIRKLTIELIEGFRPRGRCNFTEDFAEKLPIRIFMQLVDLPMTDFPTLKFLADQFTRPDGSMDILEVKKRFHDYLAPILAQRRDAAGSDLLSRMVNGDVGGRAMTDQEAVDMATQVLVGGLDTVVNFMGFVMNHLARSDADRRMLAADPRLIPRAIAELLRRYGLVSCSREVKRDAEFEGIIFRAGEMVVAPTILHGLDEGIIEDPREVRLNRGAVKHATFGAGPHRCPGSHLARSELKIMLEEWLSRIPEFWIAPGHEVVFQGGIVASILPFELAWEAGREASAKVQ
ncbi:MAG: cytochrome P450 [Parvularculaceae bacterium]